MAMPVANSAGVAGHYRRGPRLFSTSLFDVHAGVDERLGRDVAIRELRDSSSPATVERVLSAAKEWGAINHPNVVAVFDIGFIDGRFAVITEVAGTRLADLDGGLAGGGASEGDGAPDGDGAWAAERIRRIALDCANGLDASHTAGLIHGAIDANAIHVGDDGTAKIADVGMAVAAHRGPLPTSGPDDTGSTRPLPTPDVDIAALAVTMASILPAGDHPVGEVFRKATAADPAERFTSAASMASALEALGPRDDAADTVVIEPTEVMPVAPRRRRRRAWSGRLSQLWATIVPAVRRWRASRLVPYAAIVVAVAVLLTIAMFDTDPPPPGQPTTNPPAAERHTDLPPEIAGD